MASLKYTIPAGLGEKKQHKDLHYSQAVRLPGSNLVKLSGQGGWDPTKDDFEIDGNDTEGQIELAFKAVDFILKQAGLKGWENVFLMRTYHTDIDKSLNTVVEVNRKWCPNHAPIWTAIGVAKLGDPRMVIEVEVEAYDDTQK